MLAVGAVLLLVLVVGVAGLLFQYRHTASEMYADRPMAAIGWSWRNLPAGRSWMSHGGQVLMANRRDGRLLFFPLLVDEPNIYEGLGLLAPDPGVAANSAAGDLQPRIPVGFELWWGTLSERYLTGESGRY
jgi:hypothetical protein